ncbi:MAG: hypothetical protein ACK52I_20750 [Pseudomonadota bacterium]|jgi:hypothetical protein
MKTRFIERDKQGRIVSSYATIQPGYAEEELPEDQPDVQAFLNTVQPVRAVTMRQARLALHAAGKLSAIDAAIAQIGGAAQIEWEYATEVRRDWPLVSQVAAGLDMTEAELDALFTQAALL